MLAVVGDHVFLGIADVNARLEHGYFLVCKLCSAYASDEFFCLAREHRAADYLYRSYGFRFFKKHFGDYLSILSNFAIRSANIIKYSLMENNGTQFLTDILTRIHSMKEELEQLEEAVLEQLDKASEAEPQEDAPATEEVEIPSEVEAEAPAVDEAEATPAEEIPVEETKVKETPEIEDAEEETVFDFAEEEDMPDFEEETVSEVHAAAEKQPEVEQAVIEPVIPEQPVVEQPAAQPAKDVHTHEQEEASAEEVHSPEHVGGLVIDDELEVLPLGEALSPAKDAVMDKMAAKESWRTDMPGAKVSDVRSAISLNDRVLFINTLFHEDPIAFQNALSQLNSMPSFDEGARFILDKHPEWNTESDVVYRFMMAVRRKLR